VIPLLRFKVLSNGRKVQSDHPHPLLAQLHCGAHHAQEIVSVKPPQALTKVLAFVGRLMGYELPP